MDLGHLADFFEFVLASGPQPPSCGPEASPKFKKVCQNLATLARLLC